MTKLFRFSLFLFVAMIVAMPAMAQQTPVVTNAAPPAQQAPVQQQAPVAAPAVTAPVVVQQAPAAPQQAYRPRKKLEIGPVAFFNWLFGLVLGDKADKDPSDTMVAPFATIQPTQPPTIESVSNTLPVNNTPLDTPHRSTADLASWLQQAIAETLSFNADDYQKRLQILQRGFSKKALEDFNAWVVSNGILDTLKANGMQLNGTVPDTPSLENEGLLDGRYHWIFTVPVIITFVPRADGGYMPSSNDETRCLDLTLYVGRVAESLVPEHVQIETWTVKTVTCPK